MSTSAGTIQEHAAGSAALRDARRIARAALAEAAARREAELAYLYEGVVARLLSVESAEIGSKEELFVRAYQVLRRGGTHTLWAADGERLRRITRAAWTARDPGESQDLPATSGEIEEAATASATPIGVAVPSGPTAVVSDAADAAARSSSPATSTAPRPDYLVIGYALAQLQQHAPGDEVVR